MFYRRDQRLLRSDVASSDKGEDLYYSASGTATLHKLLDSASLFGFLFVARGLFGKHTWKKYHDVL